ncbi:probable NADPH dehydrogenase [Monosporozyma unispora]|nr:hypothetical protein C6P44_000141 [Kazachstania unispora]
MQSVKSAPNVSFFTPKQPILGKFVKYLEDSELTSTERTPPLLFTPLKIRSLTIPNRITVSPMCTYSSIDSYPTPFHTVHYGSLSMRGPGLLITECASVCENGKVTCNDLGLWNDSLAKEHYSKIVEFAHSQNCNIGVQLGQFHNKDIVPPIESWSKEQIIDTIKEWGQVCKRATDMAQYDFIEIQASHGHIIDQFISPLWNHRTDEYNGELQDRTRFLFQLVDEIRNNIPKEVPLFIRLPDCDKSEKEGSLTQKDTIKICVELAKHGVDVVDFVCVNPGKLNLRSHKPRLEFLQDLKQILKSKDLSLVVGSPSKISTAKEAEALLQSGLEDIILIGSEFLRNPVLVTEFAYQLGVKITQPVQYSWGFYPSEKYLETSKSAPK